MWRGDGVAERASLENWRPRKGSASSNLAPSANDTSRFITSVILHLGFKMSNSEQQLVGLPPGKTYLRPHLHSCLYPPPTARLLR